MGAMVIGFSQDGLMKEPGNFHPAYAVEKDKRSRWLAASIPTLENWFPILVGPRVSMTWTFCA